MQAPAKILVVDDTEENLMLIAVILRLNGYQAVLARCGEEALKLVADEPPDLIVMDVMMPGLDGIEVCRRLKNDERTRLIPLVIMTALDERKDKIRAIEAGADDFLTKPIDREELLARVKTALRLKRAMDEKVTALTNLKDCFSRFVPPPVRRLLEADPAAPALEKREQDLSVLFVDLSGYSRLAENMDLSKLSALVELYFSSFLGCVQGHGGDITDAAGDGMMVVFQAEERAEHARRAARAALAVVDIAGRIKDVLPEPGEPIGVHIGLNSGPALVGSTRFEGLQGAFWTYTARGPVTNLAARLGTAAAAGHIFVGPVTADRIGDRFVLEALGIRDFKNIEATEVYRLIGERKE
jgi:DNA-binding response OmpR family regulator